MSTLGHQGFHHRALELRAKWPVVYTAISKRTFCYRVLISRFVMEQQCAPINPFMNFDFAFHGLLSKDVVVTANNNLIRASDELWMFGPVSDGALAEILIAREYGHPVRFFTVRDDWQILEIAESEVEVEAGVYPTTQDAKSTA